MSKTIMSLFFLFFAGSSTLNANSCLEIDALLRERFNLGKSIREAILEVVEGRSEQDIVRIREMLAKLPPHRTWWDGAWSGQITALLKPLKTPELINLFKTVITKDIKDLHLQATTDNPPMSLADKHALVLMLTSKWKNLHHIKRTGALRTWYREFSPAKFYRFLFKNKDARIDAMPIEKILTEIGAINGPVMKAIRAKKSALEIAEFLSTAPEIDAILQGLKIRQQNLVKLLPKVKGLQRMYVEFEIAHAKVIAEALDANRGKWNAEAAKLIAAENSSFKQWLLFEMMPVEGRAAKRLVGKALVYAILVFGPAAIASIDFDKDPPLPDHFEPIILGPVQEEVPPGEDGKNILEDIQKKLNAGEISMEEFVDEIEKLRKKHPELFQ